MAHLKNVSILTLGTIGVAAIALWFHLRLPPCGPRLESQAHHLSFFSLIVAIETVLLFKYESTKINENEAGIGPYKTLFVGYL